MEDNKDSSSESDILEQQARKFQKELNSGTVSLVLLAIIDQANEPIYGYEISKRLQQGNEGKQGAIYPVLRNLNAKGLIHCEVKHSESGPPRKYFHISSLGQKVLQNWTASWRSTQQQVNKILDGIEHDE